MKNLNGLWALLVLFALSASFAIADDNPPVKPKPIQIDMPLAGATALEVFKEGTDPESQLEWEVSFVQVKGNTGAPKITAQLEGLAKAWKSEILAEARDVEPQSQFASFTQTPEHVSPTLISVQTFKSVMLAGQARPFNHRGGLTFDAKTGKRVSPKSFFVGGNPPAALIAALYTQIAEEYLEQADMLRPLTAGDFTEVVVTRTGLRFHFNDYPRVLGAIAAEASWEELGSYVDRTGPLAAFFGSSSEDYLTELGSRTHTALASLDVSERRALRNRGSSWAEAKTTDELMEELGEDSSLETVFDYLVDARNATQAQFPKVDFAAIGEAERKALLDSILSASVDFETGRVIGTETISVLPFGNPAASSLMQLKPSAIVGIESRNLGGGEDGPSYHQVRLGNGVRGLVLANSILIETPFDVVGVVSKNSKGQLIVSRNDASELLLPKHGPGTPDEELDQLDYVLTVSGGVLPPFVISGTRREIADRTWIAVNGFAPEGDESGDLAGGSLSPDPHLENQGGIVDELDQD